MVASKLVGLRLALPPKCSINPLATWASIGFAALLVAAAAATPGPALANQKPPPGASQTIEALPLAFEENRGQIDPAVQFLARGPGYQIFLTPNEAVMVLGLGGAAQDAAATGSQGEQPGPLQSQAGVLRMRFEGANVSAKAKGEDLFQHKTHYLRSGKSADNQVDISSHARVKYESLYPGVDLVYYGNQGQLEYDLLFAPGTSTDQVRISYPGAKQVSIAQDGDLVLSTSIGEMRYRKPVAYQDIEGHRKAVEASYRLADNGEVGFHVGAYDPGQILIIDPILSYSSFLWGLGVTGLALDPAGNAYIVGYIWSSDLPAGSGYQTRLTGTQDAYVAKLDPSGTRVIYATYLGARRASTYGYAIAVDSVGSAYVAGTTNSSSFPVTPGAYQTGWTTGSSFVTKLNSAGNGLVYSTFVNGGVIASLAVDGNGSAYLTGTGDAVVTTPGALQRIRSGSSTKAPFVSKLNSAGSAMSYSTYLGGSSDDQGKAIAIDSAGNAFVTGIAYSSDFPTRNPLQPSLNGPRDAFVAKLNASGSDLVYSSYLGGSDSESGHGIAVDGAGQAHVVGLTYSDDFPATAGTFQPRKAYPGPAVSNAFVAKFNPDGSEIVYASYLGGRWCLAPGVTSCFDLFSDGIDVATAVAVDAAGHAYIGGFATSVSFPLVDPVHAVGPGGDGYRAPFVTKVKPDGSRLVYSVVLGVRMADSRLNALAVDASGSVIAAGHSNSGSSTSSSPMPYTRGALLTSGGEFIFKLGPGVYPTTLRSSANPANASQPITFTADVQSTTPGGAVTFYSGAEPLGTVPLTAATASLTTSLPVGIHKITAVYSGDGKAAPPMIQTVNRQ